MPAGPMIVIETYVTMVCIMMPSKVYETINYSVVFLTLIVIPQIC